MRAGGRTPGLGAVARLSARRGGVGFWSMVMSWAHIEFDIDVAELLGREVQEAEQAVVAEVVVDAAVAAARLALTVYRTASEAAARSMDEKPAKPPGWYRQ